jgi:hypothetical protein
MAFDDVASAKFKTYESSVLENSLDDKDSPGRSSKDDSTSNSFG